MIRPPGLSFAHFGPPESSAEPGPAGRIDDLADRAAVLRRRSDELIAQVVVVRSAVAGTRAHLAAVLERLARDHPQRAATLLDMAVDARRTTWDMPPRHPGRRQVLDAVKVPYYYLLVLAATLR